jgi:hypothetical protein
VRVTCYPPDGHSYLLHAFDGRLSSVKQGCKRPLASFRLVGVMSVLIPKTDIDRQPTDIRFVPQAGVRD